MEFGIPLSVEEFPGMLVDNSGSSNYRGSMHRGTGANQAGYRNNIEAGVSCCCGGWKFKPGGAVGLGLLFVQLL